MDRMDPYIPSSTNIPNDTSTFSPTRPPSSISPAFGLKAHMTFTVVYTLLYSGIFLFVYFQLWLILYHGHKRFSYQTVFLYICLIWSALRTTLFSFFFKDAATANQLSFFPYWLLFCCPSILQYAIITLLLVFFAKLIVPAHLRDADALTRRKRRIFTLAGTGVTIFVSTNISCAVLTKYLYLTDLYEKISLANIVLARVIINDGLFMICAVCLSVCIVKLTKRPSARVAFEAKDVGVKGAIALAIVNCVIFISRGCYNFLAVFFKVCPSFGYGWINVSDQADLSNLSDEMAYFSFGLVLLFWECLPTTMIVLFFRVKTRAYTSQDAREFQTRIMGSMPGIAGSSGHHGASYFFDNRNRYNSIDDISRTTSPHSPRSPAFDIHTIGGGVGGGTNSQSHSYGRLSQSLQRPSPVGSMAGSYSRMRDAALGSVQTAQIVNAGGRFAGGRSVSVSGPLRSPRTSAPISGLPANNLEINQTAAMKSASSLPSLNKKLEGQRHGGDRVYQEDIIEEDTDEQLEEVNVEVRDGGHGGEKVGVEAQDESNVKPV